MKTRRIIPIILTLSLLLAACGKRQDSSAVPLAGDTVYASDVKPCELPLMDLSASCSSGGVLYLAGSEEAPMEDDGEFSSSFSYSGESDGDTMTFNTGGRAAIYRLDPASGEMEKLAGYAPEDGVTAAALAPGADGTVWVLEQVMGGSMETSADGSMSYFVPEPSAQVWRRLDATGEQELERIDITDLGAVSSLPDASGQIHAASEDTVTVLDSSGKTLFTCKASGYIEQLVRLADGSVAAVITDGAGRTLTPVDTAAQGFGAACPLTGNGGSVYTGDGANDFYYTSGDSLYGWPKGGTAPQKLLSWSGAGLDRGQVYALALLEDGRFAALLRDMSGWPVTYQTALLSPAEAEELAGRTTFTLATLGLSSETRAKVLAFNRTNSQYRIEIKDYSEFNTAGDASAGLTKLNTEILAGNMPDLLDISDDLPLRQYAGKGYLEDLWPYIENDPSLGRGAVMERALQAAEIGGKLYQVFSGFALETAAGAAGAVGEKMGWTLDELKAAWENLPQGSTVLSENETRSSIFQALFAQSIDQFIDWDSGTASFDSQAFQEILEFCSTFPAGAETRAEDGVMAAAAAANSDDALARVARGEQLMFPVALVGFSSVQIYRELLGGAAAFVGYPNNKGVAAHFQADGGLALSASCKDKDGAWSFLRQALLPSDAEYFTYFPVNRADFDREAEKSMKVEYVLDENGNPIVDSDGEPVLEGQGYLFINDRIVKMEPVTQADYDQVMSLYQSAGPLDRQDTALWEIVQECAGAFFAGDRTAREAAADIQNRVTLYLNEQK